MEVVNKTIQASAVALLLMGYLPAYAELLSEDESLDSATFRGETAAGTWVQREGLLGHEREQGPVPAGWTIRWDGMDNDPGSLDIGGLGGVDLTAGGVADRFVMNWSEPLTQARWVEIAVWTRDQRVSRTRLTGLMDETSAQIEVPFHLFEGDADFGNVGAVEIIIGEIYGALPNFQGLAFGPKDPSDDAGGPGHWSKALTTELGLAPPATATLILQDGDMPSGSAATVTGINAPFVNDNGEVGFLGVLSDEDRFIFTGTGIVHQNSAEMGSTLTGGEASIGIDDSGGFIYSPNVDGADAVWSQNGLVLVENTQAPGFPSGTNSTFHSRPSMIPTGTAYWIAGFNETAGTATEGRVLYTSSDASAGNVSVVLRSDDIVGGFAIGRPSGIDFDFDFSGDGSQHISVLSLDTGSTLDDGVIYVNGSIVARETTPSGQGDNWDNFDVVVINNNGDYLFSGDTDGDANSDEFIAYNGVIALREGDTIDGVQLGNVVRFVSLNDQGNAAYAWANQHLFFACDASALASNSLRVLSVGDPIDLDDDGVADATVTDLNTSPSFGPTQALAPNGRMFVEVDLDDGVENREAIIALDPPFCGQPEIEVTGNTLEIEDGDTLPRPDDGTDFGLILTGSNLLRTFVISNSGNDTLTVSVVAVSGSAFSVSALAPDGIIEVGESRSFDVTFSPPVEGPVIGTVSITSDDADENPYTFDVAGDSAAPDIEVVGNASSIINGDATPDLTDLTDFGEITVGGSSTQFFSIANSGLGTVNLTLPVTVNGSAFAITTQPDVGVLGAGQSTSFGVTASPDAAGPVIGMVSIVSDDPDENPFTFAVSASGLMPSTPVIASNDGFLVLPSATVGTVVGQLLVSDADNNIPATGAWTIVAGNEAGAFAISDDGVITVADPAALVPAMLTVRVVDSTGLSDTALVDIALAGESIFANGFE